MGGGAEGCQTLHMPKFKVRFEFLAGQIKDKSDFVTPSMPCVTKPMKKSLKIVNIPKISFQERLIANLNSRKEIWISRLEALPVCRQLPVHNLLGQLGRKGT